MKKISVVLFIGLLTLSYVSKAASRKLVQQSARTFFSHANTNPPTSPDFKQLAQLATKIIGGTVIGGTIGAVGAEIGFKVIDQAIPLHPDSKKRAIDAGMGLGAYQGIRALSQVSRPGAAVVAGGAVLGKIDRDNQKDSTQKPSSSGKSNDPSDW